MLTEDKARIEEIKQRLVGVLGKPWKYEPEHEMFIGTTNALNTYYEVIDLGRDGKEWEPYKSESSQGYQLTKYSSERLARIKALGPFLEHCREDIQFLLDLLSRIE